MNHISFENGVTMLLTKPDAGLTRLRSRYYAHQRLPAQCHYYRSTATMDLLKEFNATRLEFRDQESFHNL